MIIKKNIRTKRGMTENTHHSSDNPANSAIKHVEVNSVFQDIDIVVKMNSRVVFNSHKNKKMPFDLYKTLLACGLKDDINTCKRDIRNKNKKKDTLVYNINPVVTKRNIYKTI